jgi:hypothetical protein
VTTPEPDHLHCADDPLVLTERRRHQVVPERHGRRSAPPSLLDSEQRLTKQRPTGQNTVGRRQALLGPAQIGGGELRELGLSLMVYDKAVGSSARLS